MRILAIDTSSKSVSVALLDEHSVISELDSSRNWDVDAEPSMRAGADDVMAAGSSLASSKRRPTSNRVFEPGASTLLAPMVQSILQDNDQTFEQIDLIAVGTGPGLFTGLRVGIVTAKTLAYATQTDVLGVNTLEVIAGQTTTQAAESENQVPLDSIRVVTNAQRKQFFCGHYRAENNWKIEPIDANQILDRQPWMELLSPGDVVTGSGLTPVIQQVEKKKGITVAPKSAWNCTAAGVGQLARRQYLDGKRDNLWKLKPNYFRPSAAEEKRDAQKPS